MLHCKSPAMIAKELILGGTAYNLVRTVMRAAAHSAGLEPRSLSFPRAQDVLSAWLPYLATLPDGPLHQSEFHRMMRAVSQCGLYKRTKPPLPSGNLGATARLSFAQVLSADIGLPMETETSTGPGQKLCGISLKPALWLPIFGQAFSRGGAMHTGDVSYLDFIAPGILAQSVLFVAIFYGIDVIWERDLGIVQKLLVSPTPRAALVLGKGFSAGIRTLSRAAIVYGLSLPLGVKLNWRPLALVNVPVVVVLASTLFSTFSLIVACIVKTRDRCLPCRCSLPATRFTPPPSCPAGSRPFLTRIR